MTSPRPDIRWRVPLLSLLVAASLSIASAPVAHAVHRHGPYELAPGVKMWRVHYAAPYEVRVIRIDPTQATIDVGTAGAQFGTVTKVSTQGADNGAVAAVNGDFGTFRGQPVHPSLVDAILHTSGLARGTTLSVTENGRRAWARRPTLSVTATAPSGSFEVRRVNAGPARRKEVAAFTKVGGNVQEPATDMCSARLVPNGRYRWSNANHDGITRPYTVDRQDEPCPFDAPTFGSSAGEVILQVRRSCRCASQIKGLSVGDAVDLTWKTSRRPNITEEIGGMPMLLRAGKNVAPGPNAGSSYFYDRNPRTGVGITRGCADTDAGTPCYIYLITVDGRQQGWSAGMTLTRFASEFRHQDPPAFFAFNLDGGGASEMWVAHRRSAYCQVRTDAGGCAVNRPSDGHERSAITTLQVLRGPDRDTANLSALTDPGLTTTRAEDLATWARLAALDPGSTGGLAQVLAQERSGTRGAALWRSLLGPWKGPG
jgi:hypothetical protein